MRTSLTALACGMIIWTVPALAQEPNQEPVVAEARVINAEGNEIGFLTLSQTDEGLVIGGTLSGIPEGEHGFHVHETGACDPADGFESAGGHFDPGDNAHGFDDPDGPHAGDMRNQVADANNVVTVNATTSMVSLIEGEEGYLLDEDGSALVIHADPDDYRTDPGGNSGDRIACGVIEATGY